MENSSLEENELDYIRQVFAAELLTWKALSYEQLLELFPDERHPMYESKTIREREFDFYIRLLDFDANIAHAGLQVRTIKNKRNFLRLRFFNSYYDLFDDWIVSSGKDPASDPFPS